jgi:hypothetical protein
MIRSEEQRCKVSELDPTERADVEEASRLLRSVPSAVR